MDSGKKRVVLASHFWMLMTFLEEKIEDLS